ncbi:MAG: LysM peptidoglycan-binding domain-containing protein [Anaerolineae bacterium]|nr:LysM peptidoglycan-binding domain-containing protein [Anaerolineae bacterium]
MWSCAATRSGASRNATLGRIAQRFGTTVAAIAQANGITNINLIFVGQRLTIPGGGGVVIVPTQPGGGGQPTAVPVPTTVGGGGLSGFALGGHILGYSFVDQMRAARMTWVKQQIRWNRGDPASITQGAIQAARDRGFKVLLSVVGSKASPISWRGWPRWAPTPSRSGTSRTSTASGPTAK